MKQYNEFRINNYDIPSMINQLIKIVKKYPEILSNKHWLDDNDLTIYFNEDGTLKTIDSLMNIRSPLTKYFVTSIEFCNQNINTSFNGNQRIFIFDCIKRVITERQEKDKKINDVEPEKIVEELRKYTQISNEPSQTTTAMAKKEYYEMLREYCKFFDSKEVGE